MVGEVSQLPDWQDIPVVINFCNNKQGKGDEEKHPEDPTIAIPFDEEFPALIRVCVVGHSFIRRLRDHLFVEKGPDFNMGLDRGSVKVTFLSRGGMTASSYWNGTSHRVKNLHPHIVYLEVGSNDAANVLVNPNMIVNQMSAISRDLVQSGVQQVMFGQVLWRDDAGIPIDLPTYNWKVVLLNRIMAQVLPNLPCTSFWKHRGIWNSQFPILDDGGVHLSAIGNHRLYRSIRGAIIHAVPFVHP